MRSSVLACTGLLTLTLALTACSASALPIAPDDEQYMVASSTDLETTATTFDGRTLHTISEPGYTVLLLPDDAVTPAVRAAGALRVLDGCLEVSLVDDPARYGVVLAGGVGMGAAHLVIDGSVLRFDDSLDLPRHESFPIDDAPEAYRAACPAVTGLIGIGH